MSSSSSSALSLFKHPPLQTQTLLQKIPTFRPPEAAEQPFIQLQKIIFKIFGRAGGAFVSFRHFLCTNMFAPEPISLSRCHLSLFLFLLKLTIPAIPFTLYFWSVLKTILSQRKQFITKINTYTVIPSPHTCTYYRTLKLSY